MICEKCGFEYEGEKCPVCEVEASQIVTEQPKKSACGIVGMILGILSLVNLNWMFAIPGLILSKKALNVCPGDKRAKAGRTTSLLGLILSIALYVGTIAFIVIYYVIYIFFIGILLAATSGTYY